MAPEMLRSVISAASETAVTSLLGGSVGHGFAVLHDAVLTYAFSCRW